MTPNPDTGRNLLAWLEGHEIPTDLGDNLGLKTLMEIFGQLGIDDFHDENAAYVCERYRVNAMNEMNANQTNEQVIIFKQCLAREEHLDSLRTS